jgi:hypothetical protein
MTHPLEGAHLKVVWAEKHLGALKKEIGRYLKSRPYKIAVEKNGNVATAQFVIKTELPLHLSCILGDCLCNLRASLDYVAWQLAVRHYGHPLVAGQHTDVSFPLSKKMATTLNANSRANLTKYGIPTAAINLIESVQPGNAGYEPLGWLNTLVNIDKHCLPLLTVAHLIGRGLKVTYGGTVVEASCGSGVSWTFNASGPGIPEPKAGKMKMDGQATVFVALKDILMPLEPVDRKLEKIVKCVADIIPRFDSHV